MRNVLKISLVKAQRFKEPINSRFKVIYVILQQETFFREAII